MWDELIRVCHQPAQVVSLLAQSLEIIRFGNFSYLLCLVALVRLNSLSLNLLLHMDPRRLDIGINHTHPFSFTGEQCR